VFALTLDVISYSAKLIVFKWLDKHCFALVVAFGVDPTSLVDLQEVPDPLVVPVEGLVPAALHMGSASVGLAASLVLRRIAAIASEQLPCHRCPGRKDLEGLWKLPSGKSLLGFPSLSRMLHREREDIQSHRRP